MYTLCQIRASDVEALFGHDNLTWPQSLASNGIMHQATNSELMGRVESLVTHQGSAPNLDVKLVMALPL